MRADMRVCVRASVCSALGVDAGVVDCDARARGESRFCVLAAHPHMYSLLCMNLITVQFSYRYFDKYI
jgi:hypothetical protein